ncbi:hypothetical protein C8J55DRAFT_552069 [Lentinula edodes]|uniref:Uncharacterized protein n=1 Tax=Lentinula lateritia TaxID=40482 RepID=A0A9W8ZV54_9AGAR|nr:hypothetical protein C8J55DRAFT_552069 [Lentinula edodes]
MSPFARAKPAQSPNLFGFEPQSYLVWKKSLPDHVELAIGAKVLVTQNIKTDLGIPNGARGKIVKIVFDPREPEFEENCSVMELEYMPLYELVKVDCTRAQKLDGLEEQVIPIEPRSQTVNIQVWVGRKNYWAQGQTIWSVLVDIGNSVCSICHDIELLAEDDKLEKLNTQTAEWWKKITEKLECV